MKKDTEKEVETCDCCEVHENLLQIVNETLPEENELYDLAELFKVFGDSTRIRILFVLFEVRGFFIAARAKDKFGSLVAFGITLQIGLQAILNIAVACNAIPNTGISLPFFSYGRSALLTQLAEVGILLSISKDANT